ncbi:pancreatic lipase-related protein 2-like [Zerene cesonia]|uniref:pancreatic lipase-related protein 2-like n=1 Tax=Zerene cesonia TaxID=33412 RepID=UPI0018E5635C|nr:pancreatic lipase-related protein 2-like [Zerene cesonia]
MGYPPDINSSSYNGEFKSRSKMLELEIVLIPRVFIFAVFTLVIWVSGTCNNYGQGYGDEWLYYFDDNGDRQIMNFSTIPKSTHGMNFGEIYFHLYTRKTVDKAELLTLSKNDCSIKSLYFNKSNDIKLLTHGWLSSDQVHWLQQMKDSLLREYNLNVITVDWSQISRNTFYPWPALSTRYVGKKIAEFLKAIQSSFHIGTKGIHLIGHSLGAHVMGYAGMFCNGTLSRITGLDPARPLFELPQMPDIYCLNKDDAEFVDIIHTASGTYGYTASHGHADFFPNKGTNQPGCQTGTCSHGRACEYFDESISYSSEIGFIAYLCNSWEEYSKGNCKDEFTSMGYPASIASRGNYYLKTKNESKYADLDD